MLAANQIKVRLASALAGFESFSSFADWLSKESASLRFEDNDVLNLVDSILSPLQVYFDNLISEAKLRNELRLLVSDDVQSITVHFVVDDTHIIFDNMVQLPKPDLQSAATSQVQRAQVSFAAT